VLAGQLLLDLVHDTLLLSSPVSAVCSRAGHSGVPLLPVGAAGCSGARHSGVALLSVGATCRCGVLLVIVAARELLLDLLLDALLPPPAHAVILGLRSTNGQYYHWCKVHMLLEQF
jgi:hypothetical protein